MLPSHGGYTLPPEILRIIFETAAYDAPEDRTVLARVCSWTLNWCVPVRRPAHIWKLKDIVLTLQDNTYYLRRRRVGLRRSGRPVSTDSPGISRARAQADKISHHGLLR